MLLIQQEGRISNTTPSAHVGYRGGRDTLSIFHSISERERGSARASNQEIRLIAYWRVTTFFPSSLSLSLALRFCFFYTQMTYLNEVRSRMLLAAASEEEMQDWIWIGNKEDVEMLIEPAFYLCMDLPAFIPCAFVSWPTGEIWATPERTR